ncbi:MAG: helix-turn-helix domain-containing protein [Cyclobacteriaceae bacterium]|nr:helix-turn-helix domain-containing protein [Cyclobacteriaceae bacterium HetDA_MAG_MS6]
MKIIQEHVSLSAKKPFKVSVFDEVKLDYPLHHHRESYEITMTLGLSGTRIIGDNVSSFSEVDLVLLAPGLPHCWYDYGLRRGRKQERVVVIQFLRSLINDNSPFGYHLSQIRDALSRAEYGLQLTGKLLPRAVDLMQRIKTETFHTYLTVLELIHLFGDPQYSQKLCSEGYVSPVYKEEGQRLEQVCNYIHQHYMRKITITEVADQVNLSASAFSHYFKKRTLQSFTKFVMELRLGKAAQLLQFSEIPVTQVGFECGFQNISHFNRSFARKYDTSPLKFRKKFQHT